MFLSELNGPRRGHRRVEIKICEVHSGEDGARRADGGVEEQFDGGEVCGWGRLVAGIIDAIAANGEACAMLLVLLGSDGADDATICGPLVRRYLTFANEEASVSALQVSYSLEETTNLVGKASFPHNASGLILDEVPILQHLAGVLVDDGAEEMMRCQGGGVLHVGGKMG